VIVAFYVVQRARVARMLQGDLEHPVARSGAPCRAIWRATLRRGRGPSAGGRDRSASLVRFQDCDQCSVW